ncbi:MAG: hypothetical protein KDB26_12410 [Microthrixaceae bacterium]|nr:hypothetical protein [Microthrixaceae bacterium]
MTDGEEHDTFSWGDAATWTAKPRPSDSYVDDQFTWLDDEETRPEYENFPSPSRSLYDNDNYFGHLLTGRAADYRYLAWVQVGNPWRGVEGWWTGDEALIDAARRERGLLRDPDSMPLLAMAVVRVLGEGGRPDPWTRMVARMAAYKERQRSQERRRLEEPDPWVPPTDGSC